MPRPRTTPPTCQAPVQGGCPHETYCAVHWLPGGPGLCRPHYWRARRARAAGLEPNLASPVRDQPWHVIGGTRVPAEVVSALSELREPSQYRAHQRALIEWARGRDRAI